MIPYVKKIINRMTTLVMIEMNIILTQSLKNSNQLI